MCSRVRISPFLTSACFAPSRGVGARSPSAATTVLVALLCGLGLTVAPGCKQTNTAGLNTGTPSGGSGGSGNGDGGTKDGGGRVDAKTCPADAHKNKSKAEACTCDNECQSGFCVDGVCCSSACGDTCKACNLPNSLGDCALVPAGGKPARQECNATTAATCGDDGTCDGKGACRKYLKGTECKTGTCDGDGISGALACDGKGTCGDPVFTACAPYTCDKTKNRCATRCTNDAQCATGQTCAGGSCGSSANGASCEKGGDCASGFCVDGVCCNVECSGACVSCNQTGSVGHCQYIAADLPDPDCNAQDRKTCGNTGLCDGQGSCTVYPADTVCAPSSCAGLVENAPRTCDGKGVCRDAQLVDCAPFICGNGACTTTCDPKDANTCENGHACVASGSGYACGKRKNGQSCPDSSQCESGFCVDGVCCESECTGACRSCNLTGSPGKCTNVAIGSTDPRKTCNDKGAASCSTNGKCDGNGACQTYSQGTECGGATCSAGAYTPPSTCNAAGQCVASRSRTCSPFVCNGTACFDRCSSDQQCAAGSFCVNGSCGLKPSGANCNAGTDCKSTYCAQGVCCDRGCTDACMACNLSNSQGICTAVADGVTDPQGKCKNTAASTCSTTGACLKGACAVYKQGTSCKAAACSTPTSVKPTYTCDGAGKCTEPAVADCGSYVCSNGSCKTGCTADTDCVAPATCIKGSCGLKVNGAACTSGSQCQSGICTGGLCCNTACAEASDGLCRTCRGVGATPAGTCTYQAAGAADPMARCLATDPMTGDCSNNGLCDGSGACQHYATNRACRNESCSNGIHTAPATCKSDGTCGAAQTNECKPYMCKDGVSCWTSCSQDVANQCLAPATCLATLNRCGNKLSAGETCVIDSDCDGTLKCSAEKVCCNDACAGGCNSCKIADHLGTCWPLAADSAPRVSMCTPAATSGSCGYTGKCDGNGACGQVSSCTATLTSCPADTTTQYRTAGTCTQASSPVCSSTQTDPCASGYLCVGHACAGQCDGTNESSNCNVGAGYSCDSTGHCTKKPNGAACTTSAQCANNHCEATTGATRMCCAATCVAGEACVGGLCKKTSGQSCGDNAECVSNACLGGHCCIASCNSGYVCAGDGSCKLAQGQPCSSDATCITNHCVCTNNTCSSSVCCSGGCNGGVCTVGGATGGTCATDCTTAGCSLGFYCSNTGCAAVQADGAACGASSECQNNNCINNTCCPAGCTSGPCVGGACPDAPPPTP